MQFMKLATLATAGVLCGFGAAAQSRAPAASTGCLHQPLSVCVAWLGQNMTITFGEDAQNAINAQPQTDINGKPMPGPTMVQVIGEIAGLGLIPSLPGRFTASMDLAPDKTVKSIEISLPNDPMAAKTAQDYAKTGLWQAVNMMIGAPCNEMNETALYRFFENSVKPTISQPKKDVSLDEIHASTSFFSHSADVPFCGGKLSYSNLIETDTNDISIDNPHGISGLIGVTMQ